MPRIILLDLSAVYLSAAFNSSAVLPPRLRRRSAVSGFAAPSIGVLFSKSFAFTFAPAAINSSIISFCPVQQMIPMQAERERLLPLEGNDAGPIPIE